MKPQTKESLGCLLGGLSVLMIACIAFAIFMLSALSMSPESELYQEFPSPNGQLKAVVYERNSGATTGFSTQVSVLDRDAELSNDGGNVLAMDGHPDHTQIGIVWISDTKVRISYTLGYGDRIRWKHDRLGNIEIEFRENK